MYALDTNVIIRYLVQDDKKQAQKASDFIENLNDDNLGFISCIVLCEINWVLKTAYKVPKKQCIEVLNNIVSIANFEIENLDCCLAALRHYKSGQADFSDYLIQSISQLKGCNSVITFDKKALKGEGFKSP